MPSLPASAISPSPLAGEGRGGGSPPQSPKHHPIRHQPAISTALGERRQQAVTKAAAPPVGVSWTSLGPRPIKGLSTYGDSAGRITALAAKGSTVYAGAADGGVWNSFNSGVTWNPLTDSQATLAIGALAVDWSTTPETVYAGTGE